MAFTCCRAPTITCASPLQLGLLLQQLGRLDEAEQAFHHALEIEPIGLDYPNAYGAHLLRQGRLDDARVIVERVIEYHPDQPIGHQLKAAIESHEP